jgi:hypothetical protein
MNQEEKKKLNCNTEEEVCWINNWKTLFCSWSIIPKGSHKSGTRFNAITRLLLVSTILLYCLGLKSWNLFLCLGIFFLSCIYLSHHCLDCKH